jgi:hypothetical protein
MEWRNGGIASDAATQARIAAREVVSLESSGSFGYVGGVKSDNWETPGRRNAKQLRRQTITLADVGTQNRK